MAPGKRQLPIEELEIHEALTRPKTTASRPSEQLSLSNVKLSDGTTLDIQALIDSSVQAAMAKKGAIDDRGASGSDSRAEPKGLKRPIDLNPYNDNSKRPRSSGTPSEYDSDEEDEEEDEEECSGGFSMSTYFGDHINPVNPSQHHRARSQDINPGAVWYDDRYEESITVHNDDTAPPSRISHNDANMEAGRRVIEIGDRSEGLLVPPSQVQNLAEDSNDPDPSPPAQKAGVAVDKGLHMPTKRVPNWNPPIEILNWASQTFDNEWSAEDLKKYEDKYIPPKDFQHLFTPIPLEKFMEESLSSQNTRDTDYIFNRRETERLMFRAAKDLCAAYGPFFEVLHLLGQRGDCQDERLILSEGILGIASAMHKISRARRELLRRYFRLEISKNLYSFDPSHSQLFGGSSLEARVQQAQNMANARNKMFFRPKPKTKYPPKTGKGSQANSSQGFQSPASQPKPQRGGRRGRGRGRRSRSKPQSSTSTSTSKAK